MSEKKEQIKRLIEFKPIALILAILLVFVVATIIKKIVVTNYDLNNETNEIIEIEYNQNITNYLDEQKEDEAETDDENIQLLLEAILKKESLDKDPEMPEPEILRSDSGDKYSYIGTLVIDKIDLNMKIISKTTEELMRKSACKLYGADPNMKGNCCIIGHNWRNTKLFSKVPQLEIGDTFEITDLSDRTLQYEIYDKYIVDPEDTSCLEQNTDGTRRVTLITCTNDSKQRYVFCAEEIK